MQLFKNDAIAQMQLLHQQGVKVDAIVTDPPYGISRKNNFHTMGNRKGVDFGDWDKDFNPTSWLKPAAEFEQKFTPYLPFGTVLHGDDYQFVVTHNGLDYARLYCDETGEEYELKLVDVKRHHVLSWAVVTMYDNKTKITYQSEVKL